MKVSDVMARQVMTAAPNDPVQSVARLMAHSNTGVIPIEMPGVGTLVGLITDRDIVIRIVAQGLSTTTSASEIMTVGVESCREDDDLAVVVGKMAETKVRRLVVYDAEQNLSGIISLVDIAAAFGRDEASAALGHISGAGYDR